jgi:hypothetical protein
VTIANTFVREEKQIIAVQSVQILTSAENVSAKVDTNIIWILLDRIKGVTLKDYFFISILVVEYFKFIRNISDG